MQMLLIQVRGSSKDYADIHTLLSHGVDALTLPYFAFYWKSMFTAFSSREKTGAGYPKRPMLRFLAFLHAVELAPPMGFSTATAQSLVSALRG
jgi:hypothetical protein